MQDLARASSAQSNTSGPGPASRSQQIANNGPPTVGNARPHVGSMGPPNGNMGPSMDSQRVPMPGQSYGRVNPAVSQPMIPNHQPGQVPQPQQATRNFYTLHPQLIAPPSGPPNHHRLRGLTTHMLTHSNMSEQSVINHYQQEIEYIRSLHSTRLMTTFQEQMYGAVVQQVRQQFLQPPLEMEIFFFRIVEHALVRHGLVPAPPPPQNNQMPGRPPMGQQQGVQARDLRHDQQQPGAGVQQPGMHPLGVQQPVFRQSAAPQPPMAQQVGHRGPSQDNQTAVPGQQQQRSQVGGPAQPRPEA